MRRRYGLRHREASRKKANLPYGSARIDNEFHQNAPLAPDRMFVIGLKRPSGDGPIAADILEHEAERVAAEIRAVGGEATSTKIDVTSESEWVALIRKAVSVYGRLDILVNNAGITGSSVSEPDGVEGWARELDAQLHRPYCENRQRRRGERGC